MITEVSQLEKQFPERGRRAPRRNIDSSYINYDQFEEISQNSINMQRNRHIPTKLFKFTQLKKTCKNANCPKYHL